MFRVEGGEVTLALSVERRGRRAAGMRRYACDPWLLGAVIALVGLGLIMVYSASIPVAERAAGNSSYFLLRQLAAVVLGGVCMYLIRRTPLRLWELSGPYLLLLAMALLVLVLIPGVGLSVNGSARWLRLGVVNVQPSELVKLALVVYVAGYFVRRQAQLHNFTQGVATISLVVVIVSVLLLQEPDLGAVVVICLTVMGLFFLSGVRFHHFWLAAIAGLAAVAVLMLIAPYRLERVIAFLDPWADPFDRGFQLVQALIAFGRGEWFGVGLGASVQKLHYLPAAHTDFLFAVTAEELGLAGVLAVIGLFAVVIARAFAISRQADKAGLAYGTRLAQGVGLLLGVQAIISMGVNMGALPTKGLTLPFMSYGGTSMLVSLSAIGFLLLVEREVRERAWGAR